MNQSPDSTTSAPIANDARAFDAHARRYDADINQGLRFTGEAKEYFAEGRLNWTRRVLGGEFQTGWHCLDYGCGVGTATPFLKRLIGAASVTGVDTSEESCALARQEHGGDATFAHPDDLGARGAEFDLAYCNGVFHHIPPEHRAKAVAQIASALKPGGWFAFWENNPWNPVTRWMMSKVPFDRDAILLWPGESRRMIAAAGLKVVRTDFLFVFPSQLAFLRRLEPLMCKLPTGGQYLVLARKPLHS